MLREQFKGIAKVMRAQFESINAQIFHSGDRGSSREEQVREFLRSRFPRRFSVGKGEVLSTATEPPSLSQDVIVYDSLYCPLLLSDISQVFPNESIYAVFEVKSTLDKEELRDCANKVKSVKKFPKLPGKIRVSPTTFDEGQTTPTLGGVFAFSSSTTLRTLRRNLNEINASVEPGNRIDIICVLDKGLIVSIPFDSRIPIHQTLRSSLASIDAGEDSLLMFYLLLMDHLNNSFAVPPNLMEYAGAYALSFQYETDIHADISSIFHLAFKGKAGTVSRGYATVHELLEALKLKEESKE